MAYCPECGSEVAPNDVFCAYCGIGLPNVSLEPEVNNSTVDFSPTTDLTKDSVTEESIQNDLKDEQNEITLPDTPRVVLEDAPTEIVETIETPVNEDVHFENLQEQSSITETEQETDADEIPFPELRPEILQNDEPQPIPSNIAASFSTEVQQTVEENPYKLNSEYSNEIKNDFNPQSVENDVSDELIDIEKRGFEEKVENQLNDDVDSAIEEISEPHIETIEEISEPPIETKVEAKPEISEPEIDFDQTIRDGYFPVSNQKEQIEAEPLIQAYPEPDEEEKLKSVLEEIDLNLQNQNELVLQNENDLNQDSGVIIPTAASLQDEVFQSQLGSEQIEPQPLASIDTLKKSELIENDDLNLLEDEKQEQIIENRSEDILISAPVPTPIVEEKEGRSFTNPNIAGPDTDNRNKTKLKPLDEGTVLNNRYEIVRKIGGGGMGAVYLATDKNLGGVLRAVKEMVQSYIEDEQQVKAVNDFKRESLLLTSLEHPSIPTIYDYFYDETEARFYLVMKYISGGDLAARLRSAPEGRIDEVSVTDWAIQVSDVLDYLHNRQPPIVYRDLKPSNIMIDGNSGKLMLIDFGIARWVNSKEEKGVTAVGTMGYAPPELFSGNVEPRSDIYSLGSTMFHLLTGADPQSNPLLIFDFNKNPKPRQINSQLSDQMEQILMRAVEYNSIQRFNSAREMRDELIKHMDNLKKGTVTFGVVNTTSGNPINANVPVFCGFCGQKIVATDMFCPFCGAQQPLAAQSKRLVQAPPPYVAPMISPKLMIVGTSELETTDYILEKDSNLLGRRDPMSNIFPEVDLSKFDPQTKISRKHARIWREGDVYMLEDLGSSNGTVLISAMNGSVRLLPRQPQVLSHGDKLKLGDTTLRFTIG